MGILHRVLSSRRSFLGVPINAAAVWEMETRILFRLGAMRKPAAVQWLATKACDLSCPHCYTDAKRRTRDELTTAEVKRLVIDELVSLGRPTLVVAGGEALLRTDIDEVVTYAGKVGVPWSLHTHGRFVLEHERMFRGHVPVMVAVSLDGTRDVHDLFRGRSGSFDAALAAVRALKSWGVPEVVLGTTVTRDNADSLADILPVVVRSGADSWGLHLVAPEGRGARDATLLPTDDQLRRVAAFARRKRSVFHIEMDNEWGSAGQDDVFYRDQPFACGAGRFTCVIAPDGSVMPCTTVDPAEAQGNVRTTPLHIVWATRFAAFRKDSKQPAADIHDCWLQTRNGRSCRNATFTSSVRDGRG